MNLNKAELIGNLAADPVAKTLRSGSELVSFTLATSRKVQSGPSAKETRTEYHAITAYGKLGQVVVRYLKKGDKVYLDGRLETQRWQDKNGGNYNRTEIVANNLIMLGHVKMGNGKITVEQAEPEKTNDEVIVEEIDPEKVEDEVQPEEE
jgi:single-strand DNA-binding protein